MTVGGKPPGLDPDDLADPTEAIHAVSAPDAAGPTEMIAAVKRPLDNETIVDDLAVDDGDGKPVDVDTLPAEVRQLIANVTLARGSGAPEPLDDAPRVLGSFILLGPIGSGTPRSELEQAVEIRDIAAPRRCVLRRLPAQQADALRRIRFVTEAQLAATLTQGGLVRVLKVSEHPPYLVREYVDGLTFAELHAAVGPGGASVELVIPFALQVAETLAYVHQSRDEHGGPLHLVHGELSSETVFIKRDGRVKITEPSLCQLGGRELSAPDEARGGRDGYRAPEQLAREVVDARVDLFALGIMMFELVLGRRLHWDGSFSLDELAVELVQKQIEDGELPEALHHLMDALTARWPDERPKSAREAVRVLRAVARELKLADDSVVAVAEALSMVGPRREVGPTNSAPPRLAEAIAPAAIEQLRVGAPTDPAPKIGEARTEQGHSTVPPIVQHEERTAPPDVGIAPERPTVTVDEASATSLERNLPSPERRTDLELETFSPPEGKLADRRTELELETFSPAEGRPSDMGDDLATTDERSDSIPTDGGVEEAETPLHVHLAQKPPSTVHPASFPSPALDPGDEDVPTPAIEEPLDAGFDDPTAQMQKVPRPTPPKAESVPSESPPPPNRRASMGLTVALALMLVALVGLLLWLMR